MPSRIPVIHNPFKLYKFIQDIPGFLLENTQVSTSPCRIGWRNMSLIHVHHPKQIKEVLQTKNINFCKSKGNKHLTFLLGNGLQTSDGYEWRQQREQLQPAFQKSQLQEYLSQFQENTKVIIKEWKNTQSICIQREISKVTLKIICSTLFGYPMGGHHEEFYQTVASIIPLLAKKSKNPFALPYSVPTPTNLKLKKERKKLYKLVKDIIKKRKQIGHHTNDLLSRILNTSNKTTQTDQVLTFLLAGQGTTTNSLTFCLYLLSQNQQLQQTLRSEVQQLKRLDIEHINSLSNLNSFIKESLRLYPPSWMITRETRIDVLIGEYRIKKGETIMISPYVMHRHPDWWEDPEQFKAKRFYETNREDSKKRIGTYFPFGLGPRSCIGKQFAIYEMSIILATILSNYKLNKTGDSTFKLNPMVNLSPSQDLYCNISVL